MTDRRIIHVIRTSGGDIMATARGITENAAESWKKSGCEIFAFEIELPVYVAADVVMTAKALNE